MNRMRTSRGDGREILGPKAEGARRATGAFGPIGYVSLRRAPDPEGAGESPAPPVHGGVSAPHSQAGGRVQAAWRAGGAAAPRRLV